MSEDRQRRTVELRDPRALRALAHPTRLALVSLLRRHGPLTATQAGATLGQSPASCSFHLRQLAAWGLVEEAGGGRGRERPWRATARMTSWSSRTEETAAAGAALSGLIAEHHLARLLDWLERMPADDAAWRESHLFGDRILDLTPAELAELRDRLHALLEEYERDEVPPDARAVTIFYAGWPLREDEL